MNSTSLAAGHRIKTNSLRGGFVQNTNVYRIGAGTIGGPVLLIDANYNGQTGGFPPLVTDINLTDWAVAVAAEGWQITGETADPVGTVTLRDITIAAAAHPNSAVDISDLVLDDVTINGVPVTS
jgi:hypothetical protein